MSGEPEAERERFGVADLVVAILLGLFFAAGAWAAFGDLVGVPRALAAAGLASTTPWVTLVASVAAPIVLFVAAVLVGRGRSTFQRALILVVALAASSALGLTLYFLSLRMLPA